jgi:uncharacterized protein YpmB
MSEDRGKITLKEIVVFLVIFFAMIGSLVYGFFMLKAGEMPKDGQMSEECKMIWETSGEAAAEKAGC